jgi:hypothetical protein
MAYGRSLTKRAESGAGSASERYEYEDPDSYQDVTNPEHRLPNHYISRHRSKTKVKF